MNPAKAVPRMCNNCGTSHVEFRSGGRCPAYNTKCDFCERLGHFKVKCRAFRNQKSVEGDKPKGDTNNKTGDEASELMGVWDSNITEPQ